eukprot:6194145-Pleurochrysis_carterae.AAC.1
MPGWQHSRGRGTLATEIHGLGGLNEPQECSLIADHCLVASLTLSAVPFSERVGEGNATTQVSVPALTPTPSGEWNNCALAGRVGGCLNPMRSDCRRHDRKRCAKERVTVHAPITVGRPMTAYDGHETRCALSRIGGGVVRGNRWPWCAPRHDHLRERSSLPVSGLTLEKPMCANCLPYPAQHAFVASDASSATSPSGNFSLHDTSHFG